MENRLKYAYLTIDDGPSDDWREKLDFLIDRQIMALWFCPGSCLERHPEFFTAATAEGHLIGNHSYDHPSFSDISIEEGCSQITRTDRIIEEGLREAGVDSYTKYFRFPFGNRGDTGLRDDEATRQEKMGAFQEILKNAGYIGPQLKEISYARFEDWGKRGSYDWWWTFDCKEWALDPEFKKYNLNSLEDLLRRMDTDSPEDEVGLNEEPSGEVVLIHDLKRSTQFFQPLIDGLLAKGVRFLPIS